MAKPCDSKPSNDFESQPSILLQNPDVIMTGGETSKSQSVLPVSRVHRQSVGTVHVTDVCKSLQSCKVQSHVRSNS